MKKEISSVYIHIPFCKKICTYCDFCKFYYNEKWIDDYLNALEKEIKSLYQNEIIKTIYIGGGTPSCLNKKELLKLLDIIKIFKLDCDYEFTFECNPDDINSLLLKTIKKMGVNRLSIGIESFDKNILKVLGRNSLYEDILKKINLCRKYGFNNINVDLIYAVSKQTIDDLNYDLEKIINLNVEHISTYSLMIEKNTELFNQKTKPINEEIDYKMYDYICSYLKRNDFNHYEISNFAKKNMESKHNLVYWRNEKYYGFGAGASGYVKNYRYDNTRSLTSYITGNYILSKEQVSKKQDMDYEIILGLRTMQGISVNNFKHKYNEDLFKVYDIQKLIDSKELIYKNDYIYINPHKIYISNEILLKLI